jgi:hypothetical protein
MQEYDAALKNVLQRLYAGSAVGRSGISPANQPAALTRRSCAAYLE